MAEEKTEIIGIINPASFQALVLSHNSSQESYQYWQTQCEAPVYNHDDWRNPHAAYPAIP